MQLRQSTLPCWCPAPALMSILQSDSRVSAPYIATVLPPETERPVSALQRAGWCRFFQTAGFLLLLLLRSAGLARALPSCLVRLHCSTPGPEVPVAVPFAYAIMCLFRMTIVFQGLAQTNCCSGAFMGASRNPAEQNTFMLANGCRDIGIARMLFAIGSKQLLTDLCLCLLAHACCCVPDASGTSSVGAGAAVHQKIQPASPSFTQPRDMPKCPDKCLYTFSNT